jgi:hypothetical protein
MDDRSWMYQDSPQGLRRMDYCNEVQDFINFLTFIPRNFTEGGIRCSCRKCSSIHVTYNILTFPFLLFFFQLGTTLTNPQQYRE